jgi:hypothetical protein
MLVISEAKRQQHSPVIHARRLPLFNPSMSPVQAYLDTNTSISGQLQTSDVFYSTKSNTRVLFHELGLLEHRNNQSIRSEMYSFHCQHHWLKSSGKQMTANKAGPSVAHTANALTFPAKHTFHCPSLAMFSFQKFLHPSGYLRTT